MLLTLDSNEYIFAYGHQRKTSCETLLAKIASTPQHVEVRMSRTILEEVRRNVAPAGFKELCALLNVLGISVDEDWEVPFELGAKYESLALKSGDAFIAAYTEWTGSRYLITENRDFKDVAILPFKVVRAEEFLALT